MDVTELRRLHAAATPGPWEVSDAEFDRGIEYRHVYGGEHDDGDYPLDVTYLLPADAALIVAMHAALPVLLDRLDTYREIAERAVGLLLQQYTETEPLPEGHWLLQDAAALDTEQP